MKSPMHLIMAAAMAIQPNTQQQASLEIINHHSAGISNNPLVISPPKSNEAKLTIVHITDVYTLENFASLKTMLKQLRQDSGDTQVISVLTGDFLAPYLLSTVDQGYGMMKALAETPIDYLMWGNHEADMDHDTVCQHVKNFPGVFVNTNMQDHEAMDHQVPFAIVDVSTSDGSQCRKVGLIAVLSDDPSLYHHHLDSTGKNSAFGGATIGDPWEALKEYKDLLESPPYNCDLVIPLEHLYVPDDHITCSNFDFPLVLSGHDHHMVDETVDGTRLVKPGCDAEFAAVVEVSWETPEITCKPKISSRFVQTRNFEPCPVLQEMNLRAYDALMPLRNTELARVPKSFAPLSSSNARGSVTTMGKYICSLLRSSMNTQRGRKRKSHASDYVDAVILMGGNIRGNTDYPEGSFFSLEALMAEVESSEEVGVVTMPGWVLAKAIQETHAGDPIPGWIQYDAGIEEVYRQGGNWPSIITKVDGHPYDPTRMYRVATKISDLTNGQSATLTNYFTSHRSALPSRSTLINVADELMEYFASNVWRRLWVTLEPSTSGIVDRTCFYQKRLEDLDRDGDGFVGIHDIHVAMRDVLGLGVHQDEMTLAKAVHSYADMNTDGFITVEDFDLFANQLFPELHDKDRWRIAYERDIQPWSSLLTPKTALSKPRSVSFRREPVAFQFKFPFV